MKLTKSSNLNRLLFDMDIHTYKDVLSLFPYRYENLAYSNENEIKDKQKIVLFGRIMSSIKVINPYKNKKFSILTFDFVSENRKLYHCVIFNRAFYNSSSFKDNEITLIGNYNATKNEINVINIYVGRIPKEKSIKPLYHLIKGYPAYHFSTLVKKAYDIEKDNLYNIVPAYFRRKYQLIDRNEAIYKLHFPTCKEDLRDALKHLKYEEALLFSLKNRLRNSTLSTIIKRKKEPIDIDICHKFLNGLPFKLSSEQYKVAKEIISDMNSDKVMYRLLQGDVGSGKTIVSFLALYANYYRGDTGVLMAPTDSLARQHYYNALKIFEPLNIRVGLLVGDMKKSQRNKMLSDLEDGLIDIVIGTHSLFSKDVKYSSLGLAVIDEQHRFGVNQRKTLMSKGDACDILMMSATPIPRSLALTVYGDLEISTINEFPIEKKKIVTRIVHSYDDVLFRAIDKMLLENRKVYIVAPKIDFSAISDYSIDTLSTLFKAKYGDKVGVLTGRMSSEEKTRVIDEFSQSGTSILLSTLVIEVGIDIKTASLMIIYGADCFGLASLHQLRGRVGRDGYQSYCLLVYDEEDDNVLSRLKVLEKTNDGFEIAEADLQSRGAGELSGLKQAGESDFSFLNLYNDIKIFTLARDDAKEIFEHKEDIKYKWIFEYLKNNID